MIERDQFGERFFELLVDTILQDHQNPITKNSLKTDWQSLQSSSKKGAERKKQLADFNNGVAEIFRDVNARLQPILDYFKHQIQARLVAPTLSIVGRNFPGQTVQLDVNYFSYPQIDHLHILNEARLSALAISIYLASILSNPTDSEYKILFLDDIFIGLDMSNRLPLLRILQDHFADYQIFLTTYDRYWFEVAQDWFERKAKDRWAFLEMYADDATGFEIPRIIPTKGYLKKAEDYLVSHDYSACGMYLRKACERVLTNLLQPKYRVKEVALDEKTKNYSTEQKKLNDLILALKDFCQEENLPYADFEDVAIYKNALLNPLSHHDIATPIYKAELQAIMVVLEQLESIQIREIPQTRGKEFILRLDKANGDFFAIEFKTRDPILLMKEPLSNARLLHCCQCEQRSIDQNGNRVDQRQAFASLQELYRVACQAFSVSDSDDLLSIITLRGKSLHDMIAKHNVF